MYGIGQQQGPSMRQAQAGSGAPAQGGGAHRVFEGACGGAGVSPFGLHAPVPDEQLVAVADQHFTQTPGRGTLAQLADWTAEADKVLVF